VTSFICLVSLPRTWSKKTKDKRAPLELTHQTCLDAGKKMEKETK